MTRFVRNLHRAAWAQRIDWAAVLLGVAVLVLDVRTLAPSILWSDEAEFQLQTAVLGVPHQTGYPLYILMGKLWTLLIPLGSIAYRINLLSAVWGAITVLLVYLAIKRVTKARLAAFAAATALAVSPAFWQQSSIAGVRTFHTAFVALITLLSIGVLQGQAPLEALALAVGLGLTHHRMTLFLLPGVAWVMLQAPQGWRSAVRRLPRLALLVLAPQVLYLFPLLRGQWASMNGFLSFALATNEAPTVLAKSQAEVVGQYGNQVLPSLWRAFTPVGLIIAVIGLATLFISARNEMRARRALGVYLAIGIPVNVIFAGIHFTEDPNKYLTHGLTLMAIVLGIGLAHVPAWLARSHRKAQLALATLGLALPILSGIASFPFANQSGLNWIGPFTLDMMTGVESGSIIVADWSFAWPMRYHQGVDGQRRDVTVLLSTDATLREAEAALLAGKPVYTIKRSVVRSWKSVYPMLDAPHNLVRVLPRRPELTSQPLHESFGDALVLTGIETWPAGLTSNLMVLLRLHWQVSQPPEHPLGLTVRLINSAGDIWTQNSQKLDVADSTDVTFALEPSLPIGRYHWQIIVDDTEQQRTLGLVDLPPFEVGRPVSPAPPESVVVTVRPDKPLQSGGWSLMGTNPTATEVRPGAALVVPLFWRKAGAQPDEATAQVQLLNRDMVLTEAQASLPTHAQPGDLIETRTALEVPRALADGNYGLRVTLGALSANIGAVRVKDRPHNYRLPPAAHKRTVRLGDRIELAGYTVPSHVAPGETARLTLYWHALDTGMESWKVFIHIVGAQGQLLAQQDGIPVGWTIPTDTWVKGEFITDEYTLTIPPDSTPGTCTVRVGMYNPDSGERLPAIENGQRLTEDAITLAQLTVTGK